ncbi:uncharacterized protein ASPGLDRAFT_84499 [Aspergillus glaucus CBS 516.65]|uniref:Apple domain-containing protein n=1 Tax=Aspergillus glaucus CBS 516.65 TaxID=1160497 RepID=A0A1L9VCA5_ASPGL|nr:hypothetical protein ASPGLDRAFT_84499 [Aspergillus glaucus CBS 516.65]OJJ81472.1 hypothetical protein ASPGLDRAFT_84499 [Aspergillus glaucus CBS 516.65]
MKLIHTLAGVSLLFGLIQAQTNPEFDRHCNPVPSSPAEVEVEPGVFATYHCNKFVHQNGYKQQLPAATTGDCAKECAKRDDHAKCVWWNNRCCFYEPTTTTHDVAGGIYITYRKDCDKAKENEINNLNQQIRDKQTELESCQGHNALIEAAAQQCATDLETCQANGGGGGSGGDGSGGGGSGNSRDCASGGQTGDNFVVHGVKWGLVCDRTFTGLASEQGGVNGVTFDECLKQCADRYRQGQNNCWSVDYHAASQQCKFKRFLGNDRHNSPGWCRAKALSQA